MIFLVTCDPVGFVEVAEMLGVSRQRVHQLIKAYRDSPEPLAELAMGRVWQRSNVAAWMATHPRRTGRPPAPPPASPGGKRPPSGWAGGSRGGSERSAT